MSLPSVVCKIAFTSNAFATLPSWTDVSADLISISVRRGRQWEMNRIEAGTAVITLKNFAGTYWPGAANIVPMKRVWLYITDGVSTTSNVYTGYVEEWPPSYFSTPDKGPIVQVQCADLQKCLSYHTSPTSIALPMTQERKCSQTPPILQTRSQADRQRSGLSIPPVLPKGNAYSLTPRKC